MKALGLPGPRPTPHNVGALDAPAARPETGGLGPNIEKLRAAAAAVARSISADVTTVFFDERSSIQGSLHEGKQAGTETADDAGRQPLDSNHPLLSLLNYRDDAGDDDDDFRTPAAPSDPGERELVGVPSDKLDKELANFMEELESCGLLKDGDDADAPEVQLPLEEPSKAHIAAGPGEQVADAVSQISEGTGGTASMAAGSASGPAEQRVLGYLADDIAWSKVLDTGSGKIYFWNIGSNDVRWSPPPGTDGDRLVQQPGEEAAQGAIVAEPTATAPEPHSVEPFTASDREADAGGVDGAAPASPRALHSPPAQDLSSSSSGESESDSDQPRQGSPAGLGPGLASAPSPVPATEDPGPSGAVASFVLQEPATELDTIFDALLQQLREVAMPLLNSVPRVVRLLLAAEISHQDWQQLAAAQRAAVAAGDASKALTWRQLENHISLRIHGMVTALATALKEFKAEPAGPASSSAAVAATAESAAAAEPEAAPAPPEPPPEEPPPAQPPLPPEDPEEGELPPAEPSAEVDMELDDGTAARATRSMTIVATSAPAPEPAPPSALTTVPLTLQHAAQPLVLPPLYPAYAWSVPSYPYSTSYSYDPVHYSVLSYPSGLDGALYDPPPPADAPPPLPPSEPPLPAEPGTPPPLPPDVGALASTSPTPPPPGMAGDALSALAAGYSEADVPVPEAMQYVYAQLAAAAAAEAAAAAAAPLPVKQREYSAQPIMWAPPADKPGPGDLDGRPAYSTSIAAAPPPASVASTSAPGAAANATERKRRAPAVPAVGVVGLSSKKVKTGKMSALLNKWTAVKADMEAEEARRAKKLAAATDPVALERKRRAEIEAWKREQLQSGQAQENANFQPLPGDWRQRLKHHSSGDGTAEDDMSAGKDPERGKPKAKHKDRDKERDKDKDRSKDRDKGGELVKSNKRHRAGDGAATSSVEPASAPATASKRPDLDKLSEGLPPGWRAMWDKDSGDIYYGNIATRETTWERPT